MLVQMLTGKDSSSDMAATSPADATAIPVSPATDAASASVSPDGVTPTTVSSDATAAKSNGATGMNGFAGAKPNEPTTSVSPSNTAMNPGAFANPAATLPGGTPAMAGIGSTPPANATPGIPATGSSPSASPGASSAVAATTPDPGALIASTVELNPADLFKRVKPAVVRVNVSTLDGEGHGSGFVLKTTGIVVTNYHVIAGGTSAAIEFHDGQRIDIEGVLYMNREKDIAILKFEPKKRTESLVAIPLALELPPQGTSVVAIGAPLGLDMSITEGIVSATRTAKELETSIGLTDHDGTWVQTTAAISPGNSGGPLLNRLGEVVAINTLALTGGSAQALNFGVCCQDINQALSELEEVPLVLSPLIAPPAESSSRVGPGGGGGGRGRGTLVDVSGTPDGQKRLAELKKIQIEFDTIFESDPFQVVPGAVRAEVDDVLKKLKIEESLISNDIAILAVIIRMRLAGDKISIYITSHVFALDRSSNGPRMLKLWERTGNAGSTTVQSLLSGKLTTTVKRDLKTFFVKLKDDVLEARRVVGEASNPTTTPAPDAKKPETKK